MSPAEYIAALDRASTRCTTPLVTPLVTSLGDGHIVWRCWGQGGQGAPLVLLHGGTGSWMHWIRNVEVLSRDMMVVVPDLPGSGESASPQPPFSAESIAAMLLQGLDQIIGAQTHFSIAGFSMGGLIAGYLAQQGGSRADTLVLVGSTGMGGTRAPMEPLKSWRRLPTDEEKRAIHHVNLGILMIYDPDKIDALAVEVQSRNAAVSRIRGKHVSHTGSLAKCLPGFTGRLAGIWGEHDLTAAPYLAERRERLQAFKPAASFDIVPGAGHWVQYEAHETVNQRMSELLKLST
jgi:2-hydroxy-6-oxonona-2,4-dienedioate hydrolase